MKIEKTGLKPVYHKFLAYGQSGVGKTYACQFMPKPLILSSENGLASLPEGIPYVSISSMNDMRDVYNFLKSSAEAQYRSIVVDSGSEITEQCLAVEKATSKDPRNAYMITQDKITALIRAYRDLPYHFYMICRIEKIQDELGHIHFGPSMPGQKLGALLPYFFDYVLAFRSVREDGVTRRFIQTAGDDSYIAKDRSGLLAEIEPDMQSIIAKLNGAKHD